jgi:hypothetical protein
MTMFLLSLPAWALLLVFMGGSAVLGVAIHLLFRRLKIFRHVRSHLDERSDLVGYAFGAAGVIYAVVLAFVVVAGWEQSDRTAQTSFQERSYLSDIFEVVDGYPARLTPVANKIKRQAILYADAMSGEWAEMGAHQTLTQRTALKIGPDQNCEKSTFTNSAAASLAARCVRYFVTEIAPANMKEQTIYAETLRLLASFQEHRQNRRYRFSQHLHPIMWLSLALGGVIMVVFISMLSIRNSLGELVITAAVCGMIGMMLALTLVFDHPFNEMANGERAQWTSLSRGFTRACTAPSVATGKRRVRPNGEFVDLCR